ncbi:MAG TPA: ATP-binding protein [Desulfomonilaceae bacterium]|nr:ATP-binding protein [Desulfomonilaceae bacterium]
MAKKESVQSNKLPKKTAAKRDLKVLIVGGKTVVQRTGEILESLAPMGFGFSLVGVVCLGKSCSQEFRSAHSDFPVFHNYREVIEGAAPDLVVLATRDRRLFKRLVEIVPSSTRVLDAFALDAFQTLKRVSGQLGTTQNKLRNVQLIKEVLMAGAGISIIVIDEDFRVLDINNAILRKTHMSKQGCLGRTCHWVVNRHMEPCHLRGGGCPAIEVFETGHSTHSVREEEREDGTQRFFTISGYPLGENEQGKKCVLMVWKDVTRGLAPVLDRHEQHMRKDFSQLLHQDKMVALGKLAAAAVHDINNPIQGILTFSKLMRQGLDRDHLSPEDLEKFRSYLDLIASESARCGQILKSLLSFARLGNLQKTAVFLDPLLDEIEMLVGNEMALKGIKLTRIIDEKLPPIYGDRNQIKQALLNLILNSIEALSTGGTIAVTVDRPPNPDYLRIHVSDTGAGISASVQGNIFEPFVTTKEFGKGVGLGLSVVYGIVTQHGGTIEIQSAEGKGATFVLTIPVSANSRNPSEPS